MFCPNCGTQMKDGLKFCTSCGAAAGNTQQEETRLIQFAPVQTVVPQRHGFTTFWLILGIVSDAIGIVVGLFFPESELSTLGIFDAVFGIVDVVSIVLIFQWKQMGVWILLVVEILWDIFGFGVNNDVGILLLGLVLQAITIGVLHIRSSNGKTTWEQLT